MSAPVAVLVGRLTIGWLIIDAEPDDAKRARLEDHWIRVLRDYECAYAGDAIRLMDAIFPGADVPGARPRQESRVPPRTYEHMNNSDDPDTIEGEAGHGQDV